MSNLNYCGNPLKDTKEARDRFESVFKPSLERIGFTAFNGNGNSMINKETNQIVIITSAPSNLKIVQSTQHLIRKYRKEYENPSITYLFTREISDYPDGSRAIYMAKLQRISSMNRLRGVATGMSMLPSVIGKLKSNEPFRLIV